MDRFFRMEICGKEVMLQIMPLGRKPNVAFFNLHGNPELTEHCGKELAKFLDGCDTILTTETKSLQLTHVIARELGIKYYAVAYKSKKAYIEVGLKVSFSGSEINKKKRNFYLSKRDASLLNGKKVAIIDDVICSGESMKGLTRIAEKAGATVVKRAVVLKSKSLKGFKDLISLEEIPVIN